MPHPAIFLDRDGVLVADTGLLTRAEDFKILPGVPEAMRTLKEAGFKLVVVTNQAVVARGMISEQDLDALHAQLQNQLVAAGAPAWDALYHCPHHPHANLPRYRCVCECRKPQPGMIRRAIQEQGLVAERSFLVGDRISDVMAGLRSGCKTVWLTTGQHLAPPIESGRSEDTPSGEDKAHYICENLQAATDWILSQL
jgi:D-glycero-D-manno-heptose 1,7-bisphosphate phosphatase